MERTFAFFVALVVCCCVSNGIAQDTAESTTDSPAKPSGFQWLQQFEGNWASMSKSVDAKEGEVNKGMMRSKAVGKYWIVNEHSSSVNGMDFRAIQTLGYDNEKKCFKGSWIDSFLDHKWVLTGTLDATGKKVTLNTEGPNWEDMSKMSKYRDTYEFKNDNFIETTSQIMKDGKWTTFMVGSFTRLANDQAKQSKVTPFLMFQGDGLKAIELYKSIFTNIKVESMTKYGAGETGKEGTIKLAQVSIHGQPVKITDSPPVHDFTFTPSFSFFVQCENEKELKEKFTALSKDGKTMMPLGNYGFSKQFGWVSDKYGVSWQLNLD